MSIQYSPKFLIQWANRYHEESPFTEKVGALLSFAFLCFICSLWFDELILMFTLGILPIILITYSQFMRLELESSLELMQVKLESMPKVYRSFSAELSVLIQNPSVFNLSHLELSLRSPDGFSSIYLCNLPSHSQIEIKADLRHMHLKDGIIWGAKVRLLDSLGLVKAERYFVKECQSLVLPKYLASSTSALTHTSSDLHENESRLVLKKHYEGEFAELRPYQYFDPPNRIAWKASARRGNLLTKVYESSSEPRYLIAIDLNSLMQNPLPLGETRHALALDYVQQILKQLSHHDLAICVYDHRLLADLPLAPQSVTRQRWQKIEAYFAQALMHDCVLETQDEFWSMLSDYLLWIGADYEAEQQGLKQEPHFKPSLRLLNTINKSFMTQWLLDRNDLEDIPYLQDIGLDEVDRRLRLFCYQKGLFGTPYIARNLFDLSEGLSQVIQKAHHEQINHLIMVSHSHRLQSKADQAMINHYLASRGTLTWVQMAPLHAIPPPQLSALINKVNYVPIKFDSDKFNLNLKSSLQWRAPTSY